MRALRDVHRRTEKLGDATLRLAAGEALARASLKADDPEGAQRLAAAGLRLAGSCGVYAGTVRLYRLQAAAARARGDEPAARDGLGRAQDELKRLQQGLEPARAAALERTIALEGA